MPAPAMNTAAPFASASVMIVFVRSGTAVRGGDGEFVRNAELVERGGGLRHHLRVGVAAHDDENPRLVMRGQC